MAVNELSDGALSLLRLHFSGRSLMVGACSPDSLQGYAVEETRGAYRELAAAGLQTRSTPPPTGGIRGIG
jgi:hypothetical protein